MYRLWLMHIQQVLIQCGILGNPNTKSNIGTALSRAALSEVLPYTVESKTFITAIYFINFIYFSQKFLKESKVFISILFIYFCFIIKQSNFLKFFIRQEKNMEKFQITP